MKTDLVEIFQTIRASLQPYATRGYAVHENSESGYDLWSEKNITENNEKITERFFIGVYIDEGQVLVKFNYAELAHKISALHKLDESLVGMKIEKLNKAMLLEIENAAAIVHKHFKEKEWI